MAATKRKVRLSGGWRASILGVMAVIVMFAIGSRYRQGVELAELKGYDLRMQARGSLPTTGKVVVVAIDDASIKELGHYPWPRSVYARLIDALRDYKVSVVGLDLIFSEADDQDVQRHAIAVRLKTAGVSDAAVQDSLGPDNDEAFARALREQVLDLYRLCIRESSSQRPQERRDPQRIHHRHPQAGATRL